MANDPLALVSALQDQLRRWMDERATLQAAIDALDAKLADAAKALGIDPTLLPSTGSEANRLPRRPGRPRDGTMTEYVMTLLASSPQGLTRRDVTQDLQKSDFAERVRVNPNSIYNMLARALRKGELVEVDGRLYHSTRVPTGEPKEEKPPGLFAVTNG